MAEIIVYPDEKRGRLESGETVLSHLRRLGVVVSARCGGLGECGSCLVRVREGEGLSPMTQVETDRGIGHGSRLACQAVVISDEYDLIVELQGPGFRILDHGMMRGYPADPLTRKKDSGYGLVVESHGRIIGEYHGGIYGIAIDIGTTTLVARWMDLEDPACGLSVSSSALNPQVAFGDNVIDRLGYADDPAGRERLTRVLLDRVNRMIQEGPVPAGQVYEIVVVGNSAMRELFAGHPVGSLARSPFVPQSGDEIQATPASLGIAMNPGGGVYAPPLLGHFVGSDTLAGILATGIAEGEELAMLVDIGTNTEIAFGNCRRILVASCASGPAFEGSGVKCGTGAIPGAVRSVYPSGDEEVGYETIDGQVPSGICGSGIIDAVALMRRSGIIGSSGHFTGPGGRFVISPGEKPVFLDGEDIDAIKLAKAAVSAGTRVILDRYGACPEDISRLYLAGAFGASLDQASAKEIGLIPDLPDNSISAAGNTAIEGAVMVLASAQARMNAESIRSLVEHVSLESEPRFEDYFIGGFAFERWDLS
ncbi:MAG: ASKHA domain-containing protein [Methanoregulaceae archaeon]|nr:ASKHA domain-containing protein [Methanoregulaceae archaeon]